MHKNKLLINRIKKDQNLLSDADVWKKIKPVYLEMPAWKTDISEKETFEELPIEA